MGTQTLTLQASGLQAPVRAPEALLMNPLWPCYQVSHGNSLDVSGGGGRAWLTGSLDAAFEMFLLFFSVLPTHGHHRHLL